MLKIAIQKSGRLHNDSINLMTKCGMKFNNVKNIKKNALNFPLEIYLLRDDDIPQLLEDGVADLGIIGNNICLENQNNIKIIDKLGFGQCRLSIAFPGNFPYQEIYDLNGKIIATSYPRLLNKFLVKNNINAYIYKLSGSVEIAPSMGLSDCICDLVSSGETLFMNGLIEKIRIMECEAVLAANKNINLKNNLLKNFLLRIQLVKTAQNKEFIIFNAHNQQLNNILHFLPKKNVFPLCNTNYSKVHAVIDKNKLWSIIELLQLNGAKEILVFPISNLIF